VVMKVRGLVLIVVQGPPNPLSGIDTWGEPLSTNGGGASGSGGEGISTHSGAWSTTSTVRHRRVGAAFEHQWWRCQW
jgi:hypothetical protein